MNKRQDPILTAVAEIESTVEGIEQALADGRITLKEAVQLMVDFVGSVMLIVERAKLVGPVKLSQVTNAVERLWLDVLLPRVMLPWWLPKSVVTSIIHAVTPWLINGLVMFFNKFRVFERLDGW